MTLRKIVKVQHYWAFHEDNPFVARGWPLQRASKEEKFSISWRYRYPHYPATISCMFYCSWGAMQMCFRCTLFSLTRSNLQLYRAELGVLSLTAVNDITYQMQNHITHWGRVTHRCVMKLTMTGSDNGLSPVQAIILTIAGILLIGPLGINLSEISIEIPTFSLKKMRLKMSSAKYQPFCLGLNVINTSYCNAQDWV